MDETGQPRAFEDDPAAAFLAREQNELADIAEDTLGFTPGPTEAEVRVLNCYKMTRIHLWHSLFPAGPTLEAFRTQRKGWD